MVSATKLYRQDDGSVLQVPYQIEHPPDTQAASLWLRNRQPHRWRDKHEVDMNDTGVNPDGRHDRRSADPAPHDAARDGAPEVELMSPHVCKAGATKGERQSYDESLRWTGGGDAVS